MNENQTGPKFHQNSMLDTTECLEAVGVFKGWKNFSFLIVVLCLLVLQTCFWLVDAGCVEPAPPGASPGSTDAAGGSMAEASKSPAPDQGMQDVNEVANEETAEPNQPSDRPAEATRQKPLSTIGLTAVEAWFNITFERLTWLIRFANAVLILTATLYCLTMLFSLKVSLLGRLGGINHICRAFFLSLLMLVLLLPWQHVFGYIVLGAIYTAPELVKWSSAETSSIFGIVLYYLRFSGYWLLILLLLLFSQFHSGRWARAILHRLEII